MCTYFLSCLVHMLCLKKIQKYFKDFVVISSVNPHEASLGHVVTQGLKGLVVYARCNYDSYKSELGFSSFFSLLEFEQKLGVGT